MTDLYILAGIVAAFYVLAVVTTLAAWLCERRDDDDPV